MMKNYEFLCIISGEETTNEVTNIIETLQSLLTETGAENVTNHLLGKRRLAYKLNGNVRYGTYILFTFVGNPENMSVFQEKMRYVKGVLRNVLRATTTRVNLLPKFNDEVVEDVVNIPEQREKTDVEILMRTTGMEEPPAIETKKVVMSQDELDKRIDALLSEEVNVDKI